MTSKTLIITLFSILLISNLCATKVADGIETSNHISSQIEILKTFDLNGNFRSISGRGNNLQNPEFGAAGTNRIRIAPQELPGDGVVNESNNGLPSPRVISNAIHDQPRKFPQNQFGSSSWLWAFGQFIDHDIAGEPDLAEQAVQEPLECGNAACSAPILVPSDDPFFSRFGVRELSFHRSPFKLGSNSFEDAKYAETDQKYTQERKYPNILSHWIDASTVYGSSVARSNILRDLTDSGHGRLRSSDESRDFPPLVERTITNTNGARRLQFDTGDGRANENFILSGVHILFFREHNRLADLIWKARGQPTCDRACNNDIFEHARAIVIGLMQKITYEDWLPEFLGRGYFNKYFPQHYHYDESINPNVASEFTVAAYRVGHSMINSHLFRVNENLKPVNDPIMLMNAFFNSAPDVIRERNLIKELLLGLGAQKAERTDAFVVDALRNMLFGKGAKGMDLTSLNAQRNRDNGNSRFAVVQHYLCKYVLKGDESRCPLAFTSFEDFNGSKSVQKMLKDLYGKPENVELFVAGLLEEPENGLESNIGSTFGAIIVDQFKRLRDGDRFWYENYLPKNIIDMIKNDNLSKVLSRNLNVNLRQRNVFKAFEKFTKPKTPQRLRCPKGSVRYGSGNDNIAGMGLVGHIWDVTIYDCYQRCIDDPRCGTFHFWPEGGYPLAIKRTVCHLHASEEMINSNYGFKNILCKPRINCMMNAWSQWSECSSNCGHGNQQRSRSVKLYARNGGDGCEAKEKTQSRECHVENCCPECVERTCSWGFELRHRQHRQHRNIHDCGCPRCVRVSYTGYEPYGARINGHPWKILSNSSEMRSNESGMRMSATNDALIGAAIFGMGFIGFGFYKLIGGKFKSHSNESYESLL